MRRSFTPMLRFLVVFALCPCLAAMVGCGGGGLSGPSGAVSGKVTYNGSPVPAGCTITFVHDETSQPASGVIAADGTYTLNMQGESKVVAGAYKISISPPTAEVDVTDEAYAAQMTGEASAPAEAPFPDKYFLPATSGLTFTVAEGANTHDIVLTDD